MRVIYWDQDRPSASDIAAMWREIEVTAAAVERPAVTELLGVLDEQRHNGGGMFASVELGPHPVLDWFAARNRLGEIDLYWTLLDREPLRAQLDRLTSPSVLRPGPRANAVRHGWHQESPLVLAGSLAAQLDFGGAYSSRPDDPDEANVQARQFLDLTTRFCTELVDDRWADLCVASTFSGWDGWFRDSAWDGTWLVVDRATRQAHVLCYTDVD